MNVLRDICGEDELHYQLTRELLSIEKRHKSMLRRAGLFGAMEKAFFRHFYDDEEDALDRARQHQSTLDAARDRVFEETSSMVQEVLFDTTQNETEQ